MNVNVGADMLRKSAGIIEERQKVYGPPNKNFKNIARMMNAWLVARYGEIATIQFDEVDVVMFNDCQKSCRLAETPEHEDGWVDKAGYAACGRQVTSDVWNTEDVPVEQETTGPLVGERTEPHLPAGPLAATEDNERIVWHEMWCNSVNPPYGRACMCGAAQEHLRQMSKTTSKVA